MRIAVPIWDCSMANAHLNEIDETFFPKGKFSSGFAAQIQHPFKIPIIS